MKKTSIVPRGLLPVALALAFGLGLSAPAAPQTILIDLGPNDVTNGDITTSPDYLGQYWNNLVSAGGGAAVPSGLGLANLVTTNNTPTTLGVYVSSAGLACNGKVNGGLLSPSYAWLGNFAVTNATEDYFFTTSSGALTLTNLNPASTYQLRLFGTRETTISRITRYIVTGGNGSFTNDLTTSGTDVGNAGYDANNNTIATITGVTPNTNRQIQIGLNIVTGGFAYLGILELTDLNRPPTTTNRTLTRVSGLPVSVRKSELAADPDGDPLTFTIGTTTNGATLTQDSTFIQVPANTVDDQFAFTVNDGAGGTNSGTVTLMVGMLAPTLVSAPTASAISYGQSLASSTLSGGVVTNEASGVSVPGTFAFTTPSLTPGAAGPTNVSVTFTPADTASYYSLTTGVTVQVIGVTPTITELPVATGISYGQTLAASVLGGGAATNATAGVPVSGAFAFTTPSTVPNAGSPGVSVTFTPSDPGYNPVLTNVNVPVSQTTPVLTAPSASGIALGQSLASSTLSGGAALNSFNNAVVAGTFAFTSPSLVPGAPGPTNVGVTFTPADAGNYLPGTTAVTVYVVPPRTNGIITIYGSSVAEGWLATPTTLTNGSRPNAYAGLMTQQLEGQGWAVTNVAVPGYNTTAANGNFNSLVVPTTPNYVYIGLSLGNEGLAGSSNPSAVFESFRSGMTNLIARCRTNGYYPLVGLCYPRGDYTLSEYQYLKNMNLVMNSWDVPSLNFLGPVDDGTGRWVTGYWGDSLHPNNAGHLEMYYAFVPSLFDAIKSGRTNSPTLAGTTNFARLTQDPGVNAPLTFTPSNTVHSFTTAFRVRTTHTGTVAAVRSGTNYATIEVRSNALVYVSRTGAEVSAAVTATNGSWLDVALAHHYARQLTVLFVNGAQAGTLAEQWVPDQFILGGPGAASGRPGTPVQVDLQDWCVYRAGWTPDEAAAQSAGNLQQASMEVCAALADASFSPAAPVSNRAQSLSRVVVNTANLVAVPQRNLMTAVLANPDGTRTVNFTGEPGFGYRVQTATNLAAPAWTDAATRLIDGSGVSSFTDTNTVGQPEKFYRTVYP